MNERGLETSNISQRMRNISLNTSGSFASLGKRKRTHGYLPAPESSSKQIAHGQQKLKSRNSNFGKTLNSSHSCSQQSLISLIESQMD